jgi:hypothetical protein
MQNTEGGLQAKLRSQLSLVHEQLEAYEKDRSEIDQTLSEQLKRIESLTEENKRLSSELDRMRAHEKVRELEEQLDLRNTLHRRRGLYYKEGDDNPICPVCWDGEKKLAWLFPAKAPLMPDPTKRPGPKPNLEQWDCYQCENEYTAQDQTDSFRVYGKMHPRLNEPRR